MQYSQSDINNMRQEALRRTREMHRKSRNSSVQAELPEQSDIVEKDEPLKQEKMPSSENISGEMKNTGAKSSSFLNVLLSDIFGGGKLDNDKIIIIALIFILAKEGADLKLLLALGYILM
ncbi:MAG: hypothetical protein ACI4I9_09050 [Porcipelethomonas sp.]